MCLFMYQEKKLNASFFLFYRRIHVRILMGIVSLFDVRRLRADQIKEWKKSKSKDASVPLQNPLSLIPPLIPHRRRMPERSSMLTWSRHSPLSCPSTPSRGISSSRSTTTKRPNQTLHPVLLLLLASTMTPSNSDSYQPLLWGYRVDKHDLDRSMSKRLVTPACLSSPRTQASRKPHHLRRARLIKSR